MTKNDNQNTGAKLVTIPLRVNPETIEENGQVGQIRYVKIGAKRYPCIMAKVPKEFAHQYMQIEWAEVKAEERSERCLVEDGHGGYIMCPESNKCAYCEKYGHFDFDNFRPTSLDAMYAETEFEPAAELKSSPSTARSSRNSSTGISAPCASPKPSAWGKAKPMTMSTGSEHWRQNCIAK